MNIHWESSESHLLLNPSYSKSAQERFVKMFKAATAWPGHVWLSTSGSTVQKWVGISKHALLASAKAVNEHLQSGKEDCWVNALPYFHVGGVGIWARAHLSGAKVFDFKQESSRKWHAEKFYREVQQVEGTLTALVPTQLYDLVALKWPAPCSLRAVIIGGGVLLSSLYEQAIELGWPILPSYGLTECGSQVATAALGSWRELGMPPLQLLNHLQVCEREGRLCFYGSSLLSTYAYIQNQEVQFIDPRIQGWLRSEDRGTVQNGHLVIVGRADAIYKVGGENVDLARLENYLQMLRLQLAIEEDVALIAVADDRLGHSIHLVSDSVKRKRITGLVERFQEGVLPFERIRRVHFVPQLPRSPLGKILKNELTDLLSH
jgi:o-succinylbenzoate---CoA ligase